MFDYLLIKLASRCNLDCTYCYWFRDSEVNKLPPIINDHWVESFIQKLRLHLTKYRLRHFVCSFHGGEPLLIGRRRFEELLLKIDKVGEATNCVIKYVITTNGVLIDKEWAKIFESFAVSVAVSIDGPPHIHNASRVTVAGKATWQAATKGYFCLCERGVMPSILAVCNPETNAEEVIDHLAGYLGAVTLDVLVPDENHDSRMLRPIADYYISLFDRWLDVYQPAGVDVRILTQLIRGLLGLRSTSDQIGLGPTQTVCLNTNGQLEPNDVLRIAGVDRVKTNVDIFNNNLDEILRDYVWKSVQSESLRLPQTCQDCPHHITCGGGHLSQRWSRENNYQNVSVYCNDYKKIIDHISRRIGPHVAHLVATSKQPEKIP